MIVTSDTTALIDIRMAASTGRPVLRNSASGDAGVAAAPRISRPTTTNTMTGTASVPKSPIGSRAKILISSHVSSNNPFISVPYRVAGELQEDVLQGRHARMEIGDGD